MDISRLKQTKVVQNELNWIEWAEMLRECDLIRVQ